MLTSGPSPSLTRVQLRFTAALAHSVPGVTLELACTDGSPVTVAYWRLDADLDPCQFRDAVVQTRRPGLRRLTDALTDARIVCGAEDLGAGIYRRREAGNEERWFITELDRKQVVTLLAKCPVEHADRAVTAVMRPDQPLGVTVVRLRSTHPACEPDLDRVAWWAVGEVMVAELLAGGDRNLHP